MIKYNLKQGDVNDSAERTKYLYQNTDKFPSNGRCCFFAANSERKGIFMLHIIKHFKTVTKHKKLVFVHCVRSGIPWRGLIHDLSKYSPAEFIAGAKFYDGHRSPTELERKEFGYSAAWMHHKGRNRHHFEYWTDYNPNTKQLEAVKMPVKYVKEMFCDRVAAGKVYLGDKYTNDNPIDYFLKGRAKDAMHPQTAELLGRWLSLLQKEGEASVFREIRKTKSY